MSSSPPGIDCKLTSRRRADLTLDAFVDEHDLLMNGPSRSNDVPLDILAKHPQTDFRRIQAVATLQICNDFPRVEGLWAYLDQLDLMNEERLRPGWDTYFMVSRCAPESAAKLTTDPGKSCQPSVKLHEAARRRSARPVEADPVDGVQRHCTEHAQLQ